MTEPAHQRTRSVREIRGDARRIASRIIRQGMIASELDELAHSDRPVEALCTALPALTERLESQPDGVVAGLIFQAAVLCEEWDRKVDAAQLRARDLTADSLRELRACRDEAELARALCPSAASAFEVPWALTARIDAGCWSPWQVHDNSPPARPRGEAAATARELAGLPWESEAVSAGRPLRVAGADSLSQLPAPVTTMAGSSVVRVAPISVAGSVTSLLYLPEPPDRPLTDQDSISANISTFTVGVGAILERELLYERFRLQRVRIRESVSSMERIMASLDTGVDLVRLVGREHADTLTSVGSPLIQFGTTHDKDLTARERDVMALVALGRGNTEIARELVISTNTVKSHLHNIMRKLGAVNRTELISLHRART